MTRMALVDDLYDSWMKPVTMNTLDAVHCLIAERIPLGYTTRKALTESRRVAALYAEEHGLPQVYDIEDIDEVEIVEWLRSRGYQILDDPIPPYIDNCVRVEQGEWGPCTQYLRNRESPATRTSE